jgi:ribonuclease HI
MAILGIRADSMIEIYTDGSATVASKPGGYGYVIVANGVKIDEGSGYMEKASNNDAELEAAVQGLGKLFKMKMEGQFSPEARFPIEYLDSVTLVSDSQIVLGWASGAYRFKQQSKMLKYSQLQYLVQKLNVKTRWVQGHSGDEHNERCDQLANLARKQVSELDVPKKAVKKKLAISYETVYSMCQKAILVANETSEKDTDEWARIFSTYLVDSLKVS